MIVVIEAIRGTVIRAVEVLHGKGVIIVGEVIRHIHIKEEEIERGAEVTRVVDTQ